MGSTTDVMHNEAFNIANGDLFRWKWLWKQIGDWFGIEPVRFDGKIYPLETEMEGDVPLCQEIAAKYHLKEPAHTTRKSRFRKN